MHAFHALRQEIQNRILFFFFSFAGFSTVLGITQCRYISPTPSSSPLKGTQCKGKTVEIVLFPTDTQSTRIKSGNFLLIVVFLRVLCQLRARLLSSVHLLLCVAVVSCQRNLHVFLNAFLFIKESRVSLPFIKSFSQNSLSRVLYNI